MQVLPVKRFLCYCALFSLAGAASLAQAPSQPPRPSKVGLEDLRAAVAANPESADAQRRLGVYLRHAGESDASFEHLERAVELDPRCVDCLLSLGIAYSGEGRSIDAETTYRQLLEIEPGHSKALNNLGNVALRRGDEKTAVDLYRRALQSEPGYLLARYRLAQALEYYAQTDEAYAEYERVYATEPTNYREANAMIDSLYHLGALDLAAGKHEQAEKRLAEVIAKAPAHPSAHYGRAQALIKLGRADEARAELEIHMQLLAQRLPIGPAATSR